MPSTSDKQNERIAYTAPRWAWLAIILYLKQQHNSSVARDCLKLLEPTITKPKQPMITDYPVCDHCGSEDVQADAYATWSRNTGTWEITNVMDSGAVCEKCESPTKLHWK